MRTLIAALLLGVVACSPSDDAQQVAAQPETLAQPVPPGVDHSLGSFVDPPSSVYFVEPSGKGNLKICRPSDTDLVALTIPAGAIFTDIGKEDGPALSGGLGLWNLTVAVAAPSKLAKGQTCVTAAARVVHTDPAPNYADMKSVTRFYASDGRLFGIQLSEEITGDNLAFTNLEATATSDFN